MKARPVKRYPVPRYPTRLEVLKDRRLLRSHVPAQWLRNAEVAGALGVLLAVNGCVETGQEPSPKTLVSVQRVAPFFDHGRSRGSGGGALDLPVFLSEDEAHVVITELLRQAGVHISQRGTELPEFQVRQYTRPPGDYFESAGPEGLRWSEQGESEVKPLRVDGFDPQKKVAVEFISEEDYYRYGGKWTWSSSVRYDFRPVTESVQEQVKANHSDIYFGTFYSPLALPTWGPGPNPNGGWIRHEPTEELERILRSQVADFIEWLKGQGVI